MRKLQANFIYQFSYQLLAILLPLITAPYISRVLGAEGIGEYTYSYTIAYYFYTICMLGFDTHGQRVIASIQDNKSDRGIRFTEIFILQLLLTAFGSIFYVFYAFQLSGVRRTLALIQIIYVASSCTYIAWLYEGVEEFKNIAKRNTLIKIVSTILVFILVKKASDIWIYALIVAGSTFAGNIIFLTSMGKYVSFTKIKIRNVFKHLKPIIMVFIPQISITIFLQIDKLMLGWWSTTRELGYYQNAEKIINIPITLITTVGIVVMPRIVSLKCAGDNEKIKRFNALCMQILLIIGFGCMFGLIAISPDFTPWYFGKDFVDCVPIVTSLSVTIIFMVWENVLQKQYLVPFSRDRVVIICMGIAAVLNVILNVLLIPSMGAFGAIIGSIASHLVICVIESVILFKELPVFEYMKFGVAALIPGGVMMLSVSKIASLLPSDSMSVNILVEIVAGVLIYLVLTVLSLKLTKSELLIISYDYIKQIRSKLRR